MKRKTLRWFGLTERMKTEESMKKVYLSGTEGVNRRGGTLGDGGIGWGNMSATEALVDGEGLYLDRERWRLFCHGHPLGGKLPEGVLS